jgi:hypothetical protein
MTGFGMGAFYHQKVCSFVCHLTLPLRKILPYTIVYRIRFDMDILVLKLILAPVIIGSASLAGRKWGPVVSGWIVGMPLTSGPVIFFVALSHGAVDSLWLRTPLPLPGWRRVSAGTLPGLAAF